MCARVSLSVVAQGALITGLSNIQVAQQLLLAGLALDGVVFMDENDQKLVLEKDPTAPSGECLVGVFFTRGERSNCTGFAHTGINGNRPWKCSEKRIFFLIAKIAFF